MGVKTPVADLLLFIVSEAEYLACTLLYGVLFFQNSLLPSCLCYCCNMIWMISQGPFHQSCICAMWRQNNHLDIITFLQRHKGINASWYPSNAAVMELSHNNGSFFFCLKKGILFLFLELFYLEKHVYLWDRRKERWLSHAGRSLGDFEAGYWLKRSANPVHRSCKLIWDVFIILVVKGCSLRLPCLCCHSQLSLHAFSVHPVSFLQLCVCPPTQPLISSQEV